MPGLDTNVLVRWLVGDDEVQTARVEALLEGARAQGEGFFVPCTVALELEWVLRSRYRFEKPAVLQAFNALLETRELDFQHEDAVERALYRYRQGSADFADCLHTGLGSASGRAPLLTFDERASRLPDAALIGEAAAEPG